MMIAKHSNKIAVQFTYINIINLGEKNVSCIVQFEIFFVIKKTNTFLELGHIKYI